MRKARPLSCGGASALFALLLIVGCSDGPTGPVDNDGELRALIEQTAFGDISNFSSALALDGMSHVGEPSFDPGACPYDSSEQEFACAPVVSAGVTWQLVYYLSDAASNSLSEYNHATVDAVHAVVMFYGTVNSPSGSFAIHRKSDMTVSGLLGPQPTLSGLAIDNDTLTVGGVPTAMRMSSIPTNIVLPNRPGGYPISGTVLGVLSTTTTLATDSGSIAMTRTLPMQLTFNGTNLVPFKMGNVACTLDLSGAKPASC